MKRLFLFAVVSLLAAFAPAACAQTPPDFKRTEDIVYGRKFGTALTLDVFQPEKTNGCAVSRSRRG